MTVSRKLVSCGPRHAPATPPPAASPALRLVEPQHTRQKPYKGARKSRRNDGWITTGSSGNAALQGSLTDLRQRSRDLRRNNRYARKGLMELASYLAGLQPQSAIPVADDASDAERKRVRAVNREIDQAFVEWSKVCCVDGGDFQGAQIQAALGLFESGEMFTRQRLRRLSDGLPVPMQIELLEADFCDHTLNRSLKSGGAIVSGVELDPIGRRSAYHLRRRHPGETSLGLALANPQEVVIVPAKSVAHLFAKPFTRPGQVRGEPWLSAVIQSLLDFDGFMDAERVRIRGAASYMASVTSEEEFSFDGEDDEFPNGINPMRNAAGDIIERLRPGVVGYLQQGQKIEFNKPPNFDGVEAYTTVESHGIAAGMQMPYELLTGDLSRVNFSSIMFGMGSFWRMMGLLQRHAMIPLWGQRVWRWWIDVGIAAGVLPAEAGPVQWVALPWPVVDPIKQAKAKQILVRNGAQSLREWIQETGKDPDVVLADVAAMQKWAADNGLVLDSLANTTTLAGQVQGDAAPDPPPVAAPAEDDDAEDDDAEDDDAEDDDAEDDDAEDNDE